MMTALLSAVAWGVAGWVGPLRGAAGVRRCGRVQCVYWDPPRLETAYDAPAFESTAAADDGRRLEVRTLGFYPFPCGPGAHGPFGWLFKDTHQAVSIRCGSERLFADFMTAGGQSHPVWWDERVKWHVLLGGSIRGEVRIRSSGRRSSHKLERLRQRLAGYSTDMNLYTNNCRVFACRAVREVERLNSEEGAYSAAPEADGSGAWRELAADARLYWGLLRAGALPALYPLGVLALCAEMLRDL